MQHFLHIEAHPIRTPEVHVQAAPISFRSPELNVKQENLPPSSAPPYFQVATSKFSDFKTLTLSTFSVEQSIFPISRADDNRVAIPAVYLLPLLHLCFPIPLGLLSLLHHLGHLPLPVPLLLLLHLLSLLLHSLPLPLQLRWL